MDTRFHVSVIRERKVNPELFEVCESRDMALVRIGEIRDTVNLRDILTVHRVESVSRFGWVATRSREIFAIGGTFRL